MSRRSLVVDARMLYGSGIGRYVRELVPRIMNGGEFESLHLAGDPVELAPWIARHVPGAHLLPLPYGRYDWRVQVAWAYLRRKLPGGRRVTWFPHFDAPALAMPAPSVVTIHDLIPLMQEGMAGIVKRAMMRAVVSRVTRLSARVITVSDETRQLLIARDVSLASRIHVIPNGGAEMADGPALALPDAVRAPFLLCVANRKPHKNLVRAVETLAALVRSHPAVTLVVAGEWFSSWKVIERLAESLGVRARVIDMGRVDDALLRSLYANCTALLVPSLMEGFGLPVVEAMACGAPVVAADLPWAHALGGEAIVYADAHSTDAWIGALLPLLEQASARESAISRGRARAIGFTWDAAAHATAQVLCEVADE